MKTKEEKSAYDQEYIREKCVKKTLLINKEKDADIIEWLSSQGETFNAIVKRLIREKIEN